MPVLGKVPKEIPQSTNFSYFFFFYSGREKKTHFFLQTVIDR